MRPGLDIVHGSGKCPPFTCYETINKLLEEFTAIQGCLTFARLSYVGTQQLSGKAMVCKNRPEDICHFHIERRLGWHQPSQVCTEVDQLSSQTIFHSRCCAFFWYDNDK